MRNENKTMNVCLGYNWVRRKTAHNNNIFIHVANSILQAYWNNGQNGLFVPKSNIYRTQSPGKPFYY